MSHLREREMKFMFLKSQLETQVVKQIFTYVHAKDIYIPMPKGKCNDIWLLTCNLLKFDFQRSL